MNSFVIDNLLFITWVLLSISPFSFSFRKELTMGSKSSMSESVMKAFSLVLTNMNDMWWCTTVRTTTLFVDMFFFLAEFP